MKLILSFFLFISIDFILLTQISDAQVKTKVIFNNGGKIIGVILPSYNTDSINVKLDGGFKVSYAKSSIKEIKSLRKLVSIGIGIGIPYAMFGINTEIEPIRQVDFTCGIGTTILAGLAWDVGVVAYILDQDYSIRPKISLIYGTNSMIIYDNLNYYSVQEDNESFLGFSIGAGVKFMFGQSYGITTDIFYLLTNGNYETKLKESEKKYSYTLQDIGGPIRLSFGYQFSF